MAVLQVNYTSAALARLTTFYMFLPNDVNPFMIQGNPHYERPAKTLYLLHGYSAGASECMTGSQAHEMATKYNLAIVMPQGDNSFYLDGKGTGRAYAKYIGEELVEYVSKTFGLSAEREDVFIGGISMGGFGAIHTGLKYNDTYGKIIAFSSALIVHGIAGMKPETANGVADYDYYTAVFGDLDKVEESENNPEYLIRERKRAGKQIPPLYMACGTEDFLLKENRAFRDFLEQENVEFTYQEGTGVHDWKFWNEWLEPAIKWVLS